jgi:predicted Zn-dependent protease
MKSTATLALRLRCAIQDRAAALVVFAVTFMSCIAAPGCGYPQEGQDGSRGGGGQGPGHRPQELGLSPQQEVELGDKVYRKLLRDAGDRVLPSDAPEVHRVRTVADRIIKASEIEPLRREINLHLAGYNYHWEVNVIRDRRANALCLPGGNILVLSGILPIAETDGELATVLSHEIAHALAHHASERVARAQSGNAEGIWGKAYDRQQEAEADHIGVFLMTFAGYDPEDAVRFWRRMQEWEGNRRAPPEILSDHPSDEHRIRNLEHWIPRAVAGKRAYDEGRVVPSR